MNLANRVKLWKNIYSTISIALGPRLNFYSWLKVHKTPRRIKQTIRPHVCPCLGRMQADMLRRDLGHTRIASLISLIVYSHDG